VTGDMCGCGVDGVCVVWVGWLGLKFSFSVFSLLFLCYGALGLLFVICT
jgi:hypothetical protein